MSKVIVELSEYNDLRDRYKTKCEEVKKLKEDLHQLKEEGKVAVMVQSPLGRLFGPEPTIIEIVGMDEVRSKIEQKIIDDEAAKVNSKLIKELAEAKAKLSDSKDYIEYLQNRSLWQRIRNIF